MLNEQLDEIEAEKVHKLTILQKYKKVSYQVPPFYSMQLHYNTQDLQDRFEVLQRMRGGAGDDSETPHTAPKSTPATTPSSGKGKSQGSWARSMRRRRSKGTTDTPTMSPFSSKLNA